MKRLLENIKIPIKKVFLNYTFEIMLFLFILLMSKVIQEAYLIKDFNYLIITGMFFIGLFLYVLFNRISASASKKLYLITLIIIILICIICLSRFEFSNFKVYYKIIQRSFYYSKETYFYIYIRFFAIIIPIFTVLMIYLNKKGLGNILILINVLLMLFLASSVEFIKMKKFMIFFVVLSMTVYGCNRFINSSERLKKNGIKNSVSKSKIYQYVILTSLFAGIFSYFAIQVFGVKSSVSIIEDYLSVNKNQQIKSINNAYDLAYSGYSNEEGKLGGPIELDYNLAFKVKADDTYYLKGIVKDYYDGFKWTKTGESYERKAEGTNLRYASDNLKKYLKGDIELKSIIVYPEKLVTSTIFSPSFPYKVSLSKGYLGVDGTGSFIVLGNTSINSSYTVNFYESKDNIGLFSNVYKDNISINYDENTNRQYQKYLEVPENISPEVYKLVKSITNNCKDNKEKIESIQSYLTKNYKYSLDVSDVPEDREFVDYFLFTEKKGYCTYFATAETIMCRIAGIPSRYVEGFNMTNKKDLEGIYEVTNDMAHAWTEILLYPDEDLWCIVDSTVGAQREEYKDANPNTARIVTRSNEKGKIHIKGEKNSLSNLEVNSLVKYIIGFISLVIVLVLAFAVYKTIEFIMLKNNILKSNSNTGFYNYVKHRLSFVSENYNEDDMLWIEGIEDERLRKAIKIVVDAAYKEFYGKQTAVNLDKIEIYLFIEKYIKEKQNCFKYYFDKFLRYKPKS